MTLSMFREFLSSRGLLPTLLLVLLLSACGAEPGLDRGADRGVDPPIPDPDVSAVEPAVAAAIQEARQRLGERSSAASWGHLGMVFDAHEFEDEAVQCYRRAGELAPGEYRWPYLAALALRLRDLPAALESFAEVEQLGPRNAAVFVRFGDALLEAGRPEEGERRYRRALELAPDSAFALLGLARVALFGERPAQARQHLEAAVAKRSGFREAHSLLAQVFQQLGDAEKAQLQSAIAANHPRPGAPADPIYEEMASRGVSSKWLGERAQNLADGERFAEAEALYRQVAEITGGTRAFANLGAALAAQGKTAEAAVQYDKALSVDPRDVVALANYAQLRIETQELATAADLLRRALEVDPLDFESLLNLSLVHAHRGEFSPAVELARRAVEVNSGDVRGLVQHGNSLAAGGDAKAALEPWRQALRIDSEQLDVIFNLARALVSQDLHGEAIERLRYAMTLAPNSSRLALFLAWQLATAPESSLRDGAEAMRLATRVHKAYPQQAEAADVLAAALAEVGDFANAVSRASEAIANAKAAGLPPSRVEEFRQREVLYKSGRPYRSPSAATSGTK